ncbi:WD domain, G-beta repeat [Musa troglodytarum]|uniref:WD domain, G-beta repeat n=1 Tax=Musa troglodytarum TaxID=320322 RepID=A0A9E7JF31_9LILI|nr:WD domain, G-beta repeat [Musa troglodytarum]
MVTTCTWTSSIWWRNRDRCIRCGIHANSQLSCIDTGSQLATLTGHTYRVLYLAISPDGQVTLTTETWSPPSLISLVNAGLYLHDFSKDLDDSNESK